MDWMSCVHRRPSWTLRPYCTVHSTRTVWPPLCRLHLQPGAFNQSYPNWYFLTWCSAESRDYNFFSPFLFQNSKIKDVSHLNSPLYGFNNKNLMDGANRNVHFGLKVGEKNEWNSTLKKCYFVRPVLGCGLLLLQINKNKSLQRQRGHILNDDYLRVLSVY